MYADYEFYTETFYGTAINEADFPCFSSRASDFLDYYTKGKAQTYVLQGDDASKQVGKACCAVAEAMYRDDQSKALASKVTAEALSSDSGEVKSETVGSWSRSYATASDYANSGGASNAILDERTAYALIAQQYLLNTGLLYRGGCKL